MKRIAVGCALMLLCILIQQGNAAGIVWQTSKEAAVQLASQQNKKILLVAGRDTCPNTNYMRFTVIESTSPPVKDFVEQNYIAWYSNVDTSTEWQNYASGLGGFTLPMICVIDPKSSSTYLDSSTSIQFADIFYTRLQSFVKPPEPPPVQQSQKSSLLLFVPSLIKSSNK